VTNSVFVTGCASGIGAASAKLFKSQGAHVIGFDLKKPTEHVDQFIRVDLSDRDSIDQAVASVTTTADALCNIAGVPPTVPAERQIKINFLGLSYFTESMVANLNDGASIVNLSSLFGLGWEENIGLITRLMQLGVHEDINQFLEKNDVGGEATYAFSKQAINAWTTLSAKRWSERNITIKSVCPGPIKTPILDDFMNTIVKKRGHLPEEFIGDPEAIAQMVCFLAGQGGAWVNGSCLQMDGGLLAFRYSQSQT